MDYLDFFLRLDVGAGSGLMVRLVDSPAGEAEAPFVMPPVGQKVERTAEDLERFVQQSREEVPLRDLNPPGFRPVVEQQRDIGVQLFKALFPEPVRNRYHHMLGRLGREDVGLRIKLQMSLSDPRLVAVQNLPWELLYRAEDEAFLGLTRRTSIVRHLDLPLSGELPRLPLPLRVLVVAPRPRGVSPLPHMQCEIHALQELSGRRLEVVPLETPTLEGLRRELLAGRFHVLHFLGHGAFGGNGHEGVLYLEDGEGAAAPVSGALLADHLRDITSLRLAVLNACQTARAAAPGPFGGVATALLRVGLPAVVAMQFPIRDQAASAFSSGFYDRLLAGDPLDAAVAEGRLKIRRDLPHADDWATPVLFLRAPEGHIFEPLRRPRRARALAALGVACALAAGLFLVQSRSGEPTSRPSPPTPVREPTAGGSPGQKQPTVSPTVESSPRETKRDQPDPEPDRRPRRQALTATKLVHLLVPTSLQSPVVWLDGREVQPVKRTANLITIEVPADGGNHQIRLEREGGSPCVATVPGNPDPSSPLTPCQY